MRSSDDCISQFNKYDQIHFRIACATGQSERLHGLLEKNININHQYKFGDTGLIKAATNKHFDSVKILIEGGADVNMQSECGDTALIRSIINEKMVLYLYENGADFHIKNKNGLSAYDILLNVQNITGQLPRPEGRGLKEP